MENKEQIQQRIESLLTQWGFGIVDRDFNRPWGGFFRIDENNAMQFIERFFPKEKDELAAAGLQLSPKILVVEPGKRLSWQDHRLRAEWHRVIEGPVEYALSETDEQSEAVSYAVNDLIRIPQGMRHRLIGATTWGVVAEIWQHTNPNQPSDEGDIRRIQDDFART